MANDKPLGHRVPGRPARKITLSMDDLSLESFLVEPPLVVRRGHVVSAEETEGGFTCNIKCGNTGYWECSTTPDGTCIDPSGDAGCFSYYPQCVTNCAAGDPFSWMCR